MRPKQLSFIPKLPTSHGGELARGKRKTARPIDPKQAVHIVLRSTRARAEWSMLHPKHRDRVDSLAKKIATRHGVRLYRYANVGNHLHLLVKTPTRTAFRNFLRDLSGTIALAVTGAKNGRALAKGRFWDHLAYTRIVSFGRDFKQLTLYFVKNLFEAEGLLTRKDKAKGLRLVSLAGLARGP